MFIEIPIANIENKIDVEEIVELSDFKPKFIAKKDRK